MIQQMGLDFDSMTWKCHICGDERPDSRISVRSKPVPGAGVEMSQNVRYCNDRPDCVDGSLTKNLIDLTNRQFDTSLIEP